MSILYENITILILQVPKYNLSSIYFIQIPVLFVYENIHISTISYNIIKEHVHVRQLWYHLRPQCHEAKIDFVFNFLFPWKNYISRSVQQSIFRRFTFWTLSFIGWGMWQMFHNMMYIYNTIKMDQVLYV